MALGVTLAFGAALGLLGHVLSRRIWPTVGAALAGLLLGWIVSDYLCLPLARAGLPEGEQVVTVTREVSSLKPWSYILPPAVRLVAIAPDQAEPHGMVRGQRIVPVRFVGRSEPELTVPVLFDCVGLAQMPITDRTAFGDDGRVIDPDWLRVGEEDTVLQAACAAESATPGAEN